MSSARQMKMILIFGVLTALVLGFQNCAPTSFSSIAKSVAGKNGNGTGYDGKVYAHFAPCSDSGPIEISSAIEVKADSALLLRDACQDLKPPQPIALDSLVYSISSKDALVYNELLYNPYDAANPAQTQVTKVLCSLSTAGETTEAAVWGSGDPLTGGFTATSASVVSTDGSTTGLLSPVYKSMYSTTTKYTAYGNSSSLALGVEATGKGNLSYTEGSVSGTRYAMICHSQFQ